MFSVTRLSPFSIVVIQHIKVVTNQATYYALARIALSNRRLKMEEQASLKSGTERKELTTWTCLQVHPV